MAIERPSRKRKIWEAVAATGLLAAAGGVALLGWQSLYEESFNPHLIAELTENDRYYRLYGACTKFDTPMLDPKSRRVFGQVNDDGRRTILADTNGLEANIRITSPGLDASLERRQFGGFTYSARFGQIEISGTLTCPPPLPSAIRSSLGI